MLLTPSCVPRGRPSVDPPIVSGGWCRDVPEQNAWVEMAASHPAGGSGTPQSTRRLHRVWPGPPSFRLSFISALSPLCSRFTALSMFLFSLTTEHFFRVSRQAYCISRIQECLLDSRICSLGVSRLWPMSQIRPTACVCK